MKLLRFKRHKLFCNHTHGVHQKTKMERKTKAGSQTLSGQDHYPGLEALTSFEDGFVSLSMIYCKSYFSL